jgi:MarR family transcriptional regulator, organic hydroperoxide resistance regulator
MDIGLKNHLCFRLYVASRLIVQGYGEGLTEIGLTYPKYLVLLVLEEKGGQTVNQLGELLSLDSGTLSPLLKSLLSSGYVRRERLPEDERIVLNRLTPKGKSVCEKAKKVAYGLFEETGLAPEKHRELCSVMDDFVLRCQKILNKRSPNEKNKLEQNTKIAGRIGARKSPGKSSGRLFI